MTTTFKQKMIETMVKEITQRYGKTDKRTLSFCELVGNSNNIKLIKKFFVKTMDLR